MNTDLLLILVDGFAKATAVLLLAALLAQSWRGISAAQRHFIWLAAIVIVLLLPLTRLVAPRWSISLSEPAVAEFSPILTLETISTDEMIASTTSTPVASARPSPTWNLPDWQTTLMGVWLAGFVGIMGYRLLGQWRLRRLEKRCQSVADARLEAMAANVLKTMRISRPVRLRLSEDCRVPMTWGSWRPILALPAGALQWNDDRLAAALRHEAGHIARHDYPVRWLAHLACAVYWLNPLVWIVANSIRVAQEQATDDLVLQAGTPAEDYATQLFDSARLVATHGVFARQAVAMATPSTLEKRVLAIVDERQNRRPVSRFVTTLGALSVVLTLALCTVAQLLGAPQESTPAEKSKPLSAAKERAQQIIIPKVELRDATLAESVEFLRKKSRELSPDGQGVVIILDAPAKSDARISLSLTNVPLAEAVRYVASLANLTVEAPAEALVIGAGSPSGASAPPPANPAGGVMKRAAEIILPKVEFRDVTLVEAVDSLRAQAREVDKVKGGLNIIVQPGVSADVRITISLIRIPLSEALRYVSELANVELRESPEADAVVLTLPTLPTFSTVRPARPPKEGGTADPEQPLELKADQVTREKDGTLSAEGHAQVRSGGTLLTADQVRMKEKSRWVTATGKVEVTNDTSKTTAEKLVVGFSPNGVVSFVGPHKTVTKIPPGIPVPGKPGYFQSPYAPDTDGIDLRGFKPGTQVHCPYTGKYFVVPPPKKEGASNKATPPSVKRLAETGSTSAEIPELTQPSLIQQSAPDSPIRVRVGADIQFSTRIMNR